MTGEKEAAGSLEFATGKLPPSLFSGDVRARPQGTQLSVVVRPPFSSSTWISLLPAFSPENGPLVHARALCSTRALYRSSSSPCMFSMHQSRTHRVRLLPLLIPNS